MLLAELAEFIERHRLCGTLADIVIAAVIVIAASIAGVIATGIGGRCVLRGAATHVEQRIKSGVEEGIVQGGTRLLKRLAFWVILIAVALGALGPSIAWYHSGEMCGTPSRTHDR